MKKIIVSLLLVFLLSGIIALFWYQEWIYQMPTPVPADYLFVKSDAIISIPTSSYKRSEKPVFIHFFNPDCPCSRFNIPHFKSLVKRYEEKVDFIVVLMSDKKYSESDIQSKIGENIKVLNDRNIARSCGVYSTPQAVILDNNNRMNYRGNYNKSRYCSDTKTEYARIALDSLLGEKLIPEFDLYALKAYGCQIPLCTSK